MKKWNAPKVESLDVKLTASGELGWNWGLWPKGPDGYGDKGPGEGDQGKGQGKGYQQPDVGENS